MMESSETEAAINKTLKQFSNASDVCSGDIQSSLRSFWIVMLIGLPVAVISCFENLFVMCLFISKKKFRGSSLFFMIIIAFCDIIIAVSYILLLTAEKMIEHVKAPWIMTLTVVWSNYVRPLYTIGQIAMSVSCYVIISATLERFLSTRMTEKFKLKISTRTRICVVLIPISLAVAVKASTFFEFRVNYYAQCIPPWQRYVIERTSLLNSFVYRIVWGFWMRNILTVLLPFVILAFLNYFIIRSLKHSHQVLTRRKTVTDQKQADEMRSTMRSATRTMIAIVSSYLISNSVNVFLTTWEFIDQGSIQNDLYEVTRDVISILTVFAGGVRLPIYVWALASVRSEIRALSILLVCCRVQSDKSNTNSICRYQNIKNLSKNGKKGQDSPMFGKNFPKCRLIDNENHDDGITDHTECTELMTQV